MVEVDDWNVALQPACLRVRLSIGVAHEDAHVGDAAGLELVVQLGHGVDEVVPDESAYGHHADEHFKVLLQPISVKC